MIIILIIVTIKNVYDKNVAIMIIMMVIILIIVVIKNFHINCQFLQVDRMEDKTVRFVTSFKYNYTIYLIKISLI